MTTFEFTSPEGKTYTLEGPEGSTKEQAWQQLQRALGGSREQPYGKWESAGEGYLKGASANFRDEIYGASKASGLPDWMGGFRAPVGAGRLALEEAGGPVHQEYERARDEIRRREEAMARQNPLSFGAGEFVGAGANMAATGAAGRAVGIGRTVAPTIAGRIGQATAAGAGYGAESGAGEAKDLASVPKEAAIGAGFGGAFGAGGGAVSEALTPVARKISNAWRGFRDPDAEASRQIAEARELGSHQPAFTPAEEREMTYAGTPRALADQSERLRSFARVAANKSPEAREALQDFTTQRFQTQTPRIANYIRQLTGGGHASDELERLQTAARQANDPAYRQAYQSGAGGVWSPALERLTTAPAIKAAMQGAIERGGNRAVAEGLGGFNPGVTFENGILRFGQGRGAPPYPDAQFWDYTQRELRDMQTAAGRAGRNEEAQALGGLRRSLLAELDAANPDFAIARQGAAGFFGSESALEAGADFVSSTASIPEARRALARMSAPERELFARGFASQLADQVERSGFNRNVLNGIFINNSAARQRLEMALGPQRAQRLEALLRAEAVADRLRTAVQGNSSTVQQLIAAGLAGGVAEGVVTQDWDPRHLSIGALLGAGLRHGAIRADARVMQRVGEMLASNDPNVFARGVNILAETPGLMTWLRSITGGAAAGGTELTGDPFADSNDPLR